MKNEIIKELSSTIKTLSQHPDNKQGSEFYYRIESLSTLLVSFQDSIKEDFDIKEENKQLKSKIGSLSNQLYSIINIR